MQEMIKTYEISVKNLTKKYKNITAVDNLSLNIYAGEIFALLGVNGAGKTTTIKMLTCLASPTAGDAFVCGRSIVRESSEVKSFIAVSPQETAVAPKLTVRENLELIAGVCGFKKSELEEKVSKASAELGLNTVMNRRAEKLSGGWQRRLSIAMALICEPRVLFLDEPTLGLDVIVRAELWDIIRSLRGRVTVILTTHYMEEAEALSDRIGIMRDGQLLCTGTAEEIKQLTGEDKFENAFIKMMKKEGEGIA